MMRTICVLALSAAGILAAQSAASAQPGAAPGQVATSPAAAAQKQFDVEGRYFEACTCRSACSAELSGENPGCNAMGAVVIDKGSYDGKDLSGCRLAFAVRVDAVHIYIDGPEAKRAALESFARAVLGPQGTIKELRPAAIEIGGKDGAYTAKVDGGKVLSLSTEPVMGGDHKTPVEFKNTQHPLNPVLYQGHAIAGSLTAGVDSFTIEKGRNSFFNAKMKASGKI